MTATGLLFFILASTAAAQSLLDLPAQAGPTETAPALSVRDKFDYRVVQSFGLRGFAGAALGAAVGQAADSPHEWGQGASGFATRFGSGFGGNLTRQSMSFALESTLHEDPRYFPSAEKRFGARLKSALVQSLVAHTDSGGERIAYARIASAFGNGQLVNVWQPASNNSVGNGIVRGLISLGADAGYNVLQEFFPFLRPRALRH